MRLADRFWSKVEKTDGCWWWLGSVRGLDRPYGQIWCEGRTRPAAKVSWELVNGRPFPDGMDACHTCDQERCVRPDHIFPGTQVENQLDAVSKGRHANASKTHCRNGHELTPENTHVRASGWRICRTCHNANNRTQRRRISEAKALATPPGEIIILSERDAKLFAEKVFPPASQPSLTPPAVVNQAGPAQGAIPPSQPSQEERG